MGLVIFHLDGYALHRQGLEAILEDAGEKGLEYELRSFGELKEFSYIFVDEGCRADIYILGNKIFGDGGFESSVSAFRVIRTICPEAKILAVIHEQDVIAEFAGLKVNVLNATVVDSEMLLKVIKKITGLD